MEQPGLFHLMVPLQELVGLPLEPRISVKVDIDAENEQVGTNVDITTKLTRSSFAS